MKICIIADNLDTNSAGVGSYARNICRAITNYDKKNDYIFIHGKKNSFYKDKKEIIIPYFNFFIYHFIRKFIIFPLAINKVGFDIVHDTYHFMPLNIRDDTIKIVTIHDLFPLLDKKNHRLISYIAHKLLMRTILNKADLIIAVSENTKRDIINLFGIAKDKIRVVYESVDEDYKMIKNKKLLLNIKKKYNLPDKFILHVGTIEPRKNIPMLLRSFKEIKEEYPGYKLVFVGKFGWKYGAVFNTIKALNIEGNVMFLGYINREDIPLIYNLAKVLVYPSLYEGFGLPPLEAMKCGTPVITSNTSSLPEVVGDAAIKVDPTNYYELTNSIRKIISNKDLRKSLINKGFKRASKFSWEVSANKMVRLYEDLKKR